MRVLILAEHDGKALLPATLKAVTAAQNWNAPIDILLVGWHAQSIVENAAKIAGVSQVLYAEAAHLAHPLAEDVANILLAIVSDYQVLLAAHSSFAKNILPRIAALSDVAMLSNVIEIQPENTYLRACYAGNILTTVQNLDTLQVLTVQSTGFAAAAQNGYASIVSIDVPAANTQVRWLSQELSLSDRPALSSAPIVVAGGRSLGSADKFAELLTPLADKLGAALGATRAAVDAGYAPNDIQVGQTGVVVAPELYIAIGISGAIQHTYGMKDSKIVVAINQDPDAAIFQVADYGLVADLFEAVPLLTQAI
jgi:electron transfer flavoprotein alpha subunit